MPTERRISWSLMPARPPPPLPIDARRKELADPAVRARILENPPDASSYTGVIAMVATGYGMMYPLGDPPDYEPAPDRSVAAIAEALSINLLSAEFPHVEVGSIVTSIIQLSTKIASTRQK